MLHKRASRVLISAVMLLTPALPVAAQDVLNEGSQPTNPLVTEDMTREELAGVYQALLGGGFQPQPCVDGSEMFTDVPFDNLFCPWIEELARRGITGGCTTTRYCPSASVTRSQMAVFVVRAIEAARDRFAVVSSAGTLLRGAGAVSAHQIAGGVYEVFFDADITGCAFIGTVGNPGDGNPANAFAVTALRAATTNGVFIRTVDPSGTEVSANFHLQVVC